jgi:Fic family protein
MNREKLERLKEMRLEYEKLKAGQEQLLETVMMVELVETVYNSNAIENSALTLKDTENIILNNKGASTATLREIYEAVNLSEIIKSLGSNPEPEITIENIEKLHGKLLSNIDPRIAGRIRARDENVRVGMHIAPRPEKLHALLTDLINEYKSSDNEYFIDKIAKFHLGFESIHPFGDGNGRMGRVIINWQLLKLGYPPIIVRNRTKRTDYYPLFTAFLQRGDYKKMSNLIYFALSESLNKRLAYLRGDDIIPLTDYAKEKDLNINSTLNSAKRQTLPAFRVMEKWMIGKPA